MVKTVQPSSQASYWLPANFKVDPNGYYAKKAYQVYDFAIMFIQDNISWLKKAPGAHRTLFIKFPEAIILISKRLGPTTSLPGYILRQVARTLMPLKIFGEHARPYLSFLDIGAKFSNVVKESETEIKYVMVDRDNKYARATLPLNGWIQWSGRGYHFANWLLSIGEFGGYLWKLKNPMKKFPLTNVTAWAGRFMHVQSICFESWFIYQTWSKKQRVHDPIQKKDIDIQVRHLSNPELTGSLLKISLAVVCLSIDFFKILAAKESKPLWLDSALFWTIIGSTFLTPIAYHYWPSMVLIPLQREIAQTESFEPPKSKNSWFNSFRFSWFG